MTDYNLKPCPFCGSAESLGIEEGFADEVFDGPAYYVECAACRAQGPYFCKDRNEASSAWNKRVEPANADLIAALEHAVAKYGKPGGPWNVPSGPGGWLATAQAALAKAKGEPA